MGREAIDQKSVKEAAIHLYSHLESKGVDIVSSGSSTLMETEEEVITIHIIGQDRKETLPEEYQGYKVFYTFFKLPPPRYFDF